MPDPAYAYRHQVQRAAALAALADGSPCPDCRRPMFRDKARNWDGRVLHYDHIIPVSAGGANGPKQLCHASCNQSRGGQIGARITNGMRRRGRQVPRVPVRTWAAPRGTYDRW